ncbi:MAG: cell division protein ZapB [Deltaproteobacteria bacterium]|jgi:predicted  nucleic acid-binding Zn-ribbon protein|nr:cell division protein ZapB [Deltaproteobacteria bacterium]
MDSDKLALLEAKITQLIEQNDLAKKEQERFSRELETRDKRIGELDRTLKRLQRDHKSAKVRLDRILDKLEAIT